MEAHPPFLYTSKTINDIEAVYVMEAQLKLKLKIFY